MKFHSFSVALALMAVLAGTKGEYSVKVSPNAYKDGGVWYKQVAVSGNGVADELPVRKDMVKFIVANDKELVVGDKMYSNKAGTLVVLGPETCERRMYSGGVVTSEQLTKDECYKVKLAIMKALLREGLKEDEDDGDDWSVVVNGDSEESSDEDMNLLDSYTSDELRQLAAEIQRGS